MWVCVIHDQTVETKHRRTKSHLHIQMEHLGINLLLVMNIQKCRTGRHQFLTFFGEVLCKSYDIIKYFMIYALNGTVPKPLPSPPKKKKMFRMTIRII